jgi:hypothetical protein
VSLIQEEKMRIASIWDGRIYRRHRAASGGGANYRRSVENSSALSKDLRSLFSSSAYKIF